MIILFRKVAAAALIACFVSGASAQGVNTWAGNTSEDFAEMQRACGYDAHRFCGGVTILIFEMENCLKGYLPRLTKACRAQLTPTDFRKYYRREADWLPF